MNTFTKTDQKIVRWALAQLPLDYQQAIIKRFWEKCSIQEIAQELGVSWSDADYMINKGIEILRNECEGHPYFSKHTEKKKKVLFSDEFPLVA